LPRPVQVTIFNKTHIAEDKAYREIHETQDDDREENHPVLLRLGADLLL
jgi:hypothetical protein